MKEALKLALYALKLGDTVFYPQTSIAIAAIEKALAQQNDHSEQHLDMVKEQQAQEPVGWMLIQGRHEELSHWPLDDDEISRGWEQYPLYTTPQQRTEERNFCARCGKRTADLTVIHTCTPPQETTE
jgi:hypothetical protein